MKYNEYKMIGFNTSHVTNEDSVVLNSNEHPYIHSTDMEFGWLIYLNEEFAEDKDSDYFVGFSEAFKKIYCDAVKEKAGFLLLDCDEIDYDEYPKFNW